MSFSLYSAAQGYTLTSMEMPRSAGVNKLVNCFHDD